MASRRKSISLLESNSFFRSCVLELCYFERFNPKNQRMYLDHFLSHCTDEKRLSEKTVKAYRSDLNQFQLYSKNQFGIEDLSLIKKEHIKKHLAHINSYAPRTVKRKVATLKVFFSHLAYEESIPENPFDKLRIKIKVSKSLPAVLSLAEVESILVQLQRQKQQFDKSSSQYQFQLRDIAIVELLFATGIRVSELWFLTIGNISIEFTSITILGKGNKERRIPITNPNTRKALLDYYRECKTTIASCDFFFINRLGNRISEQSVRFLVKRVAKAAGITREITPHVFRHTFATLLLEANIDIRYIQELLGHSSIAITQIYTHVSHSRTVEILQSKHPRNLIAHDSLSE